MKKLLVLLLLAGCTTPPRLPIDPHGKVGKFTLPSLKSLGQGKDFVTLAWDNVPRADATNCVTGLECSTNLLTWKTVVVMPYVEHVLVTLSNRPPYEFYRAYNAIK